MKDKVLLLFDASINQSPLLYNMNSLFISCLFLVGFVQNSQPWAIIPQYYSFTQRSTTCIVPGTSNRGVLEYGAVTPTTLHERADYGDDDDDSDDVFIDTSLPRDESIWKTEGERIIRTAAIDVGGGIGGLLKEEDIDIQWKSGRIVVTIANTVLEGRILDDDDVDDEGYSDDDDHDDNDFVLDDLDDEDGSGTSTW